MSIADPPAAGWTCEEPLSALASAGCSTSKHVGGAFFSKGLDTPPEGTAATDRHILIPTFGCRGDYLDEWDNEPRDWEDAIRRLRGVWLGAVAHKDCVRPPAALRRPPAVMLIRRSMFASMGASPKSRRPRASNAHR